MIIGVLLITAGCLLFLDNLSILPYETADSFWPLVLCVLGGIAFYRTCSTAVKVWAATGFVAGILLVLGNFHIIHATVEMLWPMALIAAGITMMIYRLRWREFKDRFSVGSNMSGGGSENMAQEYAVFSHVRRRMESTAFEGGEFTAVFGAIEYDLRWASMGAEKRVVIEANTAFGSIELRVPEAWKVQLEGTAVFGQYEDKTIPPRPEPGVPTPTLVVRGGTAFGAVTLRN